MWISVLLVLVGLLIPAVINLSGVKNMGSVQVVTTIIKFIALAFMATVGLFYIKSANFHPRNVSKESTIGAIGGGMAIALFSYLGVECAAVAAGKVRNPDRNIPRATMICAEMPLAAANDGLFPRQFKHISKKQVPAYGIVASTVLASIAIVINYVGSNGATVFTTLVLMTGITSAIPYGFSAQRRHLTQPPPMPPYPQAETTQTG
jgi:amino acid transporter